ncbi:hypothetical protein BH10CYA1_BH10CYA1_27650 [soil metagenome]
MEKFRDTYGSEAEEYHLESNNKKIMMQMPVVHQINYDAKIRELALYAPHRLKSAGGLNDDSNHSIALPIDDEIAAMSVEKAITSRISTRRFSKSPLPLSKLAKVLFLANGVRKDNAAINRLPISRNVPNSGGLGSVEIYCFCLNVENVDAGLYYFDSVDHELRLFKKGHFGTWLSEFVCLQYEASEPAVVLVLTSSIGRLSTKYGPRSYRLGLLDTGHVSNNVYLTCTALNLNVFAFGGFVDDELNRALELEGLDQCAFLCLGVGCS